MRTNVPNLLAVAAAFGVENATIHSLGNGLIHQTFLAKNQQQKMVIQGINNYVFNDANKLINNYLTLYGYLQEKHFFIPKPLATNTGSFLFLQNEMHWRATGFVENSISFNIITSEMAAANVAATFGSLIVTLADLDSTKLSPTIPNFHHVLWRENQLKKAVEQREKPLPAMASSLLSALSNYHFLGKLFQTFTNDTIYKNRLLHHDCKINNILFDAHSKAVICPIDFDTLMPGKFFSDFGDMVRTMVCSSDENNTNFAELSIKENYYKAIYESYYATVANDFTNQELSLLHASGLLMYYMQSIRFLTDYINGNIYYAISYENQNLDRAFNQFTLLEKLTFFLKANYGFEVF